MISKKTKITLPDVIIGLLLMGFLAFIVYRMAYGLDYKWQWEVIPQYLFRYDHENGRWVMNLLMKGLKTTITLSFWSIILATVIGSMMGIFRISNDLFKRLVGRTYVELVRNLPPLVIVLIFYYFISDQIMPILGVDEFIRARSDTFKGVLEIFTIEPHLFTEYLSAVITVALFEGAVITEIVRSGIQSIEKGQWEASYALGLSWWQQMRHIILPQGFQRVLPPLAGEFINTVKNSAIVSVISVHELTFQGLEIMNSTFITFEICITVALMYLVICLVLSLGVSRLETYMLRRSG